MKTVTVILIMGDHHDDMTFLITTTSAFWVYVFTKCTWDWIHISFLFCFIFTNILVLTE